MSPNSKGKKDHFMYDYKKKEEEIKNIITPKTLGKKKESHERFQYGKMGNCNNNNILLLETRLKSSNNVLNNRIKFDNDYYKNELKNKKNFFNEPKKKIIYLFSKEKKTENQEKNKNKIFHLQLNLEGDDNSLTKNVNLIRKQNNIEFQEYLNSFRTCSSRNGDNTIKFNGSNNKETMNNTKKVCQIKDQMKKRHSIFKNEQIKFLNNL